VYVACSTRCYARYPLDLALRTIGELEFNKLDVVITSKGPHLKPSDVSTDVSLAAQRIRIGPSLSPAAISADIDASTEDDFHRQLRGICHLARLSHVCLVTVPAAPAGTDLDAEVQRLTKMTHLTEKEGVVLSIPTRIGTLTENPDVAVELCQRVPGLGLTLDPSHYLAGPHQGKSFDQVYPYVRHVYLRDTGRKPGQFQVRIGQGEVEYGRIITQLTRHHYNRLLTVDIHDVTDAPFVMEQEVRKLKYLLESLV
jgi:sugar phosphate isomerase/epimerase